MKKNLLLGLLTFVLASCGGGGGGSNPPPPPTLVPVDVITTDNRTGAAVEGVAVVCNSDPWGLTNADGYLVNPEVISGKLLTCDLTRDGYHSAQATHMPAPDATRIAVALEATAAPVPVSRNARQGQLRLEPFHDDAGGVLPLYAHHGSLFRVYTVDAPRALQQLDVTATAGYQGLRVWLTLGCGDRTAPDGCRPGDYWRGWEVGPDYTPDYWGKVRAFALELRQRGLRLVASQGDIGQIRDRTEYMRLLAAVDLEVGGFIDFIDGANEAWQTGEPDPGRLAQFVRGYSDHGGRAIRSLTSPPGETAPELNQWSIDPAQVYDVHTYRGGHSWDKRRHIFSIPYEQKPERRYGIGSEPPGNGELVSVTDNKHELDDEAVPLLAITSMMARQAFVWFAGEGVKLNRGIETEAGFWTTPKAVDRLPRDLMAFQTLHHGGDSWRGTRVLAAVGEGRADCRTANDGRFACTLDGPTGVYDWPVERPFTGIVCNAGDDTCSEVTLQPGDRLHTPFRRGRYVVGRVQ